MDYCEAKGIAFIPWFPLATGKLARSGGPLEALAKKYGASPSQLALAWLLKRSPVMLPIPGTSKVAHLEENIAAAQIVLDEDAFAALRKKEWLIFSAGYRQSVAAHAGDHGL